VYVEAKVYGCVDAAGDLRTAVCEEDADRIYIEALTPEGEYEIFDSEAYHLERWCQDHGFRYYEGTLADDVELEELV
jgi:hypothetical protein